MTVFAVLREDRYESVHGDGMSLDLWSVFANEEEAELAIDRDREAGSEAYRRWTGYYIRKVSIALRGTEIDFALIYSDPNDSFLDGMFASFTAAEVMRMVEARHSP